MLKTQATYRRLTVAEIPIARTMRAAMIVELNGADPDETYPGWRERYVEFYTRHFAEDRAALFVAEIDGDPVGVAAVYLVRNHRTEIMGRPSAYVSNVYVYPQHRRKGLAAALMQLAVEWSKKKGCEVVRLRTSPMGRSVYASAGFRPSDEMELRLD